MIDEESRGQATAILQCVDVLKKNENNKNRDDKSDHDENIEALVHNCDGIVSFIETLNGQSENMSAEELSHIEKLKLSMRKFLDNDGKGNNRELEKENKDVYKTGARPKTKEKLWAIKSEDTERSSESSGDESGADERTNKGKRDRKVKDLVEVLNNLDTRKVLRMSKFDEKGEENLEDYLEKFEYFCLNNYKGSEDYWIEELESQLAGRLLDGMKSLKCYTRTYKELKEKLIILYNDQREIRNQKNKKRFKNAQMKQNEQLYLFTTRLEGLYKTAYPKHSVNKSKTLFNKLKESLPSKSREALNTQIMTINLHGRKIDCNWNFIQNWARLADMENENENSCDESEIKKSREITINLSSSKTKGQSVDGNKTDNTKSRWINQEKNNDDCSVPVCNVLSHQKQYRPQQRRFERINFRAQQCVVCYKYGHNERNCRRRLNQCYLCGSGDHFVRSCNKYYRNKGQNTSKNGYSFGSRNNRSVSANQQRSYVSSYRQRSQSQNNFPNRRKGYNRYLPREDAGREPFLNENPLC